jgi:hypothetical protein
LETAASEVEDEAARAPEPTPSPAAEIGAQQRPYQERQFGASTPQRHPVSATPPAPAPPAPEPPAPAPAAPASPSPADDDQPVAADARADTDVTDPATPAAASTAAPREGSSAGETAFGVGEVRWAPELPPGWVPAQGARAEDVREPEVVGGGPPTYGPEPTAWPEAQPDALDGLLADTVLDGASYGTWTLRTASIRGDSARYRGQPRRDALLTARFGDGDDALLLIAVASGARAADDAHRAAQDAVRWIAGAVGRSRARLADDLRAARRGSLKSGLHRLTDRCYGRLRARGEDLGLDEGTYTASLRCLLLPADPESRVRLFFGVGEGGLFRIRDGAWQDLDLAPDAASAPFRFRATVAQPGDALVMSSAGLAEPLRGEPELGAHLAARWGGGRVPGLAAYLADAQTRVKGYADDRTVVTVWDA